MVVFKKYVAKWYASLPDGEWAFGDHQGLYEWRGNDRIDYSGADKQAAMNGARLVLCGNPEPRQRGIAAALDLNARRN